MLIIICLTIALVASIAINVFLLMKNRLTRKEMAQIRKNLEALLRQMKDTQTIATKVMDDTTVSSGGLVRDVENSISRHLKQDVLNLVSKYRKDIEESDLPRIQQELKEFFRLQPRQPYYMLMDQRYEKEDRRIVIIGDTHCDYNSLAGIFEKISYSSYDYFERAYFVFLGDYLDRGNIFFEYLMLLVGFKKLLGERCIFLKGNHELIAYDNTTQNLISYVYPADTCPLLNDYCGEDKEFLSMFAEYFANLPYYILLKHQQGTDLLVHGGIPRDNIMDKCTISHETGEMIVEGDETVRHQILSNMIWSDPRTDRMKMQIGGSRFEFGREQFNHFVNINKIDRIFRSHEPVLNGVEAFYEDKLFTVFSNGGEGNPHTGYQEVMNPVFAVMNVNGSVYFESIFFKKVRIQKGHTVCTTVLYMGKTLTPEMEDSLEDLYLNNEFLIDNK